LSWMTSRQSSAAVAEATRALQERRERFKKIMRQLDLYPSSSPAIAEAILDTGDRTTEPQPAVQQGNKETDSTKLEGEDGSSTPSTADAVSLSTTPGASYETETMDQ
jgi:hypothetical protein